MASFSRVLALPRSGRLRRIVTAYTVNQLGTWFGYVALSVAVFNHTHSAFAVSGMFVASRFLPALLVPPLVARIERSPRRGGLSRLYALEGVLAGALAVLMWHFWLPAILILVAVDGTAELAASALLRAQASREDPSEPDPARTVHEATSSLNMAFAMSVVSGPALAGVVVSGIGVAGAMLVDAGSFLACSLLLLDLHAYVGELGDRSVASRLASAWSHLRRLPTLRWLLVAEGVALVFFELVAPVEVFYARTSLHAGNAGYAALLAAWGVGMVAGSVLFAGAKQRKLGLMLTAGTLLVGVSYVGFAVAPTLILACVAAAFGGFGNGIQWASLLATVQRMTPERLHGGLMGGVEAISGISPAVGLPLGGLIAAVSSPRMAFLSGGLAASAMTVVFWRLTAGGLERHFEGQAGPAGSGTVQDDPLST